MGPAHGKGVVAEIQEGVLPALGGTGLLDEIRGVQGDVGINMAQAFLQELHRLVAKGTAGEQAPHIPLAGGHFAGLLLSQGLGLRLAHGEAHEVLDLLALQ